MSIGIAVIGAGAMGADHARRIAQEIKGLHLAVVSDIDADRARAVVAASDAEGAEVITDAVEAIRSDRVDAVLIAAPDRFHASLTLECLRAGKPVLCEKPLAPTGEECLEVLALEDELAAQGGTARVSLGFMRRFDPGYLELKELAQSGGFGAALMLHCSHRNATGSADGSEHTVNASAVHEFDVIPWLLGSPVRSASWHAARSSSLTHRQDPQLVLLETESGVLVTLELFVNAQFGYEVRCELVCETGTSRLEDGDALTTQRHAGLETTAVPADFTRKYATAYRDELRAWARSLKDGTAPEELGLATAWDGYLAAITSDAVLESMHAGDSRRVDVAGITPPALYA